MLERGERVSHSKRFQPHSTTPCTRTTRTTIDDREQGGTEETIDMTALDDATNKVRTRDCVEDYDERKMTNREFRNDIIISSIFFVTTRRSLDQRLTRTTTANAHARASYFFP